MAKAKYCCAYGCTVKQGQGYAFHKFPDDKIRLKLWCYAIRRKNFMPTKHSRICSKHFTDDSYEPRYFGFPLLKKTAVPSIFNFPPNVGNCNVGPTVKKEGKPPLERNQLSEEEDLPSEKPASCNQDLTAARSSHGENSLQKTSPKKRHAYLGDFQIEDMNSPEKAKKFHKLSVSKVARQERIIQKLRKDNRSLQMQVEALKCIVKSLKENDNYVDEEAAVTLKCPVPETVNLALKQSTDGHISKEFPQEMKDFALTLQFHSDKAYEFVRGTIDNCLPHPATLKKWHSKVGRAPSYNKEVLTASKFKAEQSEKPLASTLLVDEMPARIKVECNEMKPSELVDYVWDQYQR